MSIKYKIDTQKVKIKFEFELKEQIQFFKRIIVIRNFHFEIRNFGS